MPKEPQGRRGRKDEELWIRNYDRKYTILDRLGIGPRLLSIVFVVSFCVASASLVFAIWQSHEYQTTMSDAHEHEKIVIAAKDQQILKLQGQVDSLSKRPESCTAKDQQISELRGQVESLRKKCKCK